MSENSNNQRMPFGAKNYALMAVGVLVIDCTAMGFSEPIFTPPKVTSCALRRPYFSVVLIDIFVFCSKGNSFFANSTAQNPNKLSILNMP